LVFAGWESTTIFLALISNRNNCRLTGSVQSLFYFDL
jgi:hypothetical protein